jgi:hypothetical protein
LVLVIRPSIARLPSWAFHPIQHIHRECFIRASVGLHSLCLLVIYSPLCRR